MRAIKRYYTEIAEKKAAYYKKFADKALTHSEKIIKMMEEQEEEIKYIDRQYDRKAKQCNELTQKCAFYLEGVHYYREKMIEGNEKLQIYKNAVDEFIKRHPEFNEELNEIIRQEEEESEEEED